MKRFAIGLAALLLAASAQAQTYFLVAHWFENGKHHCRYSNGAVTVVIGPCDPSIEG